MFKFIVKAGVPVAELKNRLAAAINGDDAPFAGEVAAQGFQLQLCSRTLEEKAKFASVKMRVRDIRRADELSETLDSGKLLKAGTKSAGALLRGDIGGAQDFLEHGSKRLLADKGAMPVLFGEFTDSRDGAIIRGHAFPPMSEAVGWCCFGLLGIGIFGCLLFLPVEELLMHYGVKKSVRTASGEQSPTGAILFLGYFTAVALMGFITRRVILFRRNVKRAKQLLRLIAIGSY